MKIIHGKLHIILGSYNDQHHVVDIDAKGHVKLHKFKQYEDACVCNAGLIYLKQKENYL